jgi:hypothetical protein
MPTFALRLADQRRLRFISDGEGSPMPLNSASKYPSRRTYVLKVRSDARPDALVGRIENLVTGEQWEFTTDRELIEAIARDLAAESGGAPPERP